MTVRLVSLGDVAELRSGVGFPKSFQGRANGDFPFAKVGDVSAVARSGGRYLATATNYVMAADLVPLKARPFPPGTIAFAKIGEAIRQNFCAVAQVPILLDNNVMGAIPGDEADPGYLFHFLASLDLYRFAQVTTVPSLRKSELAQIAMPLPPLAEQRRIASVLDAADALRTKRRQALASVSEFAQSAFHDQFIRSGRIPGSLDTTLGEVAEIVSGSTPKTAIEHYWDGDIRWVTPKDLSELTGPYIGTTERTLSIAGLESCSASVLPAFCVLLSSRAPIGYVAINSVPMATNQGFKSFVLDSSSVDPRFLYSWLHYHRPQLQAMGSGATFKEVSKRTVSAIGICVPPIQDQRAFGEIFDAAESMRVLYEQALTVHNDLFGSLQQRAFRGEL